MFYSGQFVVTEKCVSYGGFQIVKQDNSVLSRLKQHFLVVKLISKKA